MRELSELYTEAYLTEGTRLEGDSGKNNTLQQQAGVEDVIEYEDLDFDLDDKLNQETYYAGGDECDSRNKTKPKMKKSKTKMKKESFQSLAASLLNEEFGDEYDDDDDLDMGDEFGGDDFGGDDESVSIPASTLRDIISQLQGLVGDDFEDEDEFADDEFSDDEFADDDFEDDFPTESWDGGKGAQRLNGDYSGKPKAIKNSNLNDKGRAKTGARPNRSEGGSTGDQRMRGDTSGKARSDRGSTFTKGGNINKGNAKTNFRKANPEQDLFG